MKTTKFLTIGLLFLVFLSTPLAEATENMVWGTTIGTRGTYRITLLNFNGESSFPGVLIGQDDSGSLNIQIGTEFVVEVTEFAKTDIDLDYAIGTITAMSDSNESITSLEFDISYNSYAPKTIAALLPVAVKFLGPIYENKTVYNELADNVSVQDTGAIYHKWWHSLDKESFTTYHNLTAILPVGTTINYDETEIDITTGWVTRYYRHFQSFYPNQTVSSNTEAECELLQLDSPSGASPGFTLAIALMAIILYNKKGRGNRN